MTLPYAEPNRPLESARIPELDGIRGIAILLVVISHYLVFATDASTSLLELAGIIGLMTTWTGVDLFFVLSGFLIGGILMDNREAPNYFKVFYTRRVLRIFPLYFLWLGLFVVLVYGVSLPLAPTVAQWVFGQPMPLWTYFTFTQNFAMGAAQTLGPTWLGITWSLAVEEQFYFTLPLLIRLCPPRRLPYVLGGLIVLAPLLRVLTLGQVGRTVALFVLLPYRMDALLLGVLCAWLLRQERVRQYLQRSQAVKRVFYLLLAGAIGMTFIHPQTLDLGMLTYGYSWFALLYACVLILALTQHQGAVSRIARNAPLRNLGILAYGVYMFHDGLNGVVFGLFFDHPPLLISPQTVLATLLSTVLTILLAHLSWHYFEKRLVSLGHRVKYDTPSLPEPQPEQPPDQQPEPEPVASG